MIPITLILTAVVILAVILLWRSNRRLRRERFIRDYVLPKGLLDRFGKRHPRLTVKDRALVARGLRQFFLAHHLSGGHFVSMPSQVVDDLWHEFILYTRNYEQFCRTAFGRFLHHTPAVALETDRRNNEGLRRCWFWCCREENIDPRTPSRLPLLFALDAKFGIPGGFVYAPNCRTLVEPQTGTVHCGADLGSGTGSDGDDSVSDASDGGGSCGGGCGGG